MLTRHLPKLAVGLAACLAPAAASAQTVVAFNGTLLPSCVLSISTPGLLGANLATGTEIGSEQTGGAAAVVTVVATAGRPTLTVGAPTMSQRPAAYTGTPVVSVRYSSTGGGSQAYTTAQTSYASSNILGDTLTLNVKADDSGGFAAGSYRVQTTVTCQQ